MTSKIETLRPCPFCGSKKVEICRTNPGACWVRCGRCGADAPSDPERKVAIRIWNRRPKMMGDAKIVTDDDATYWQDGD